MIMKLDNFDLASPYATIELVGLGHRWDLHSWADFVGVTFAPEQDEMAFEWRVPLDEQNPWGSPGNRATGCRLRFRRVFHLAMSGRDPAYPKAEALTIDSISKAIPGERDYPFKREWAPDEPFHLRFQFHDSRTIDVGAELATLEAIT